jgi:hypothetical protein
MALKLIFDFSYLFEGLMFLTSNWNITSIPKIKCNQWGEVVGRVKAFLAFKETHNQTVHSKKILVRCETLSIPTKTILSKIFIKIHASTESTFHADFKYTNYVKTKLS